MVIESPPLVFYGPPATSTGALLSGQLHLVINVPEMSMVSITVTLRSSVTTKKPVHAHCPDCATTVSEVFRVDVLKEQPVRLRAGSHAFPFSHLLPGHLPATTQSALAGVSYALHARATATTDETFAHERPLDIQRAVLPAGSGERMSQRIFPPTDLKAYVVLPAVVHPAGDFPVQMRLEGLVHRGKTAQTQWRLRKLSWRIEEHARIVSPACARHAHKLLTNCNNNSNNNHNNNPDARGVLHQDTRVVGALECKSGWKTDFTDAAARGRVEAEFRAAPNPQARPACDVELVAAAGLAVAHTLVLELVVAEEFCPVDSPRLVTPTGVARVLRMTFALVVTARSGLGISWDEEQPPIYDDVPPSPPSYTRMDDFPCDELDDEDDGEHEHGHGHGHGHERLIGD
jgi:hypothetical protein